jgi:DNA primase
MSKINYQDINVEDFLNELGMRNVKRDGKEIFFSCPFEGHVHGDLNPSASMQQGSTKCHCFGCGFNGNALTFLAEYENCSPIKAARYIREWMGVDFKEPEEGSLLKELEKFFSKEETEKVIRNRPIDKSELAKRRVDWQKVWKQNSGDLSDMFYRGFNWQTLEEWNIGWDDISRRFSIPWFDNDDLIGFKGRALDREIGPGQARYLVLGGPEYGFDTFDVSLMFFGMNKLRHWNDWFKTNRLLVVEGELNTIALHQMQIGPAIGISGKHLSDAQLYLLSKFDKELIMFFDDEHDARKAAEKTLPFMRTSIIGEHDKDAADSTADEIRNLLSEAKSAIIV